MGGCASKSSVLKGDEAIPAPPPAPSPAPQKEDDTVVKEAVVEDVKMEEGVPQADDDDDTDKNRSLGNLFKESEERKDSAEKETVKATDVPESTPKEVEKLVPEDAPVKTETSDNNKTYAEKLVENSGGTSDQKKYNDEKVGENTDVKLVTPTETKLGEIKPNIVKPEEKTETKKEEKEEETKSPFVEAEERFETPKEEEPKDVKLTAAGKKAEHKIVIPEAVKPNAGKKAEEKTVFPEEKKPEIKPVSEVEILDQTEGKK